MPFDRPYTHSINGKLVEMNKSFDVFNLATSEVLAQAPGGTPERMEAAIAAAKRAFPD